MSISAYIKSDLQVRLRNGQELPAELTLESLAEHYEVSFTPVREAVKQLVAEGWLQKGANRRLTVVVPPVLAAEPAAVTTDVAPEPPRDLMNIIEQDLVRLSLQGEAVQIREEAAAQRYGISRSAVRNIFHRFAGAGLLEHLPRRGWQVRPFRQSDMHAFLEVRELLELKALELARPRIDPARIQQLLDCNRFPLTEADWPQIDNSLHAYLIELAGNPYISDFFLRQGRFYDILFDWEDQDRDTAIETVRQHREILEAIQEKEWSAARKALAWHIRWNHPILSRLIPRDPVDGLLEE
jgi:DNA-binding GntR family transcriptional regulator